MLQSVLDQTDVEVATILNTLGYSATQIADELATVYGDATGAIASVLSDIGLSTSTIDAIGGAFSSFGSDLSSGWSTVTSWF